MSEFIDSKNERVTRFCQLLDRMTNGVQRWLVVDNQVLNAVCHPQANAERGALSDRQ